MSLKKKDVLSEIKNSELFKTYSKVGEESIDREPITQEVNPSGEALSRFHNLQRHLKRASRGPKDVPDELENDAGGIWRLVDKSIMACLSEDGQILPADFLKFFSPLAGMVEGYLSVMRAGNLPKMEEVRHIRTMCKEKAFAKQLKKLFEKEKTTTIDVFSLIKALQSLGTHLAVGFEKIPETFTEGGLLESVHWLIGRLIEKAKKRRYDISEELLVVKSWRLVTDGTTR